MDPWLVTIIDHNRRSADTITQNKDTYILIIIGNHNKIVIPAVPLTGHNHERRSNTAARTDADTQRGRPNVVFERGINREFCRSIYYSSTFFGRIVVE